MKILHKSLAVLLCMLILLSDTSKAFAEKLDYTESNVNVVNTGSREIKLKAGNGTVNSGSIILEDGKTLPQRLPEATRTGWTFAGWYTAEVTENYWGDQEGESFSALLEKCGGNKEEAVEKDFSWIVESEGTLVEAGQELPADVDTLYAMYKPTNDITIRWHYNGWKKNTGIFLTHYNKEYGSPVVLADLESFLAWEDHEFAGWYTEDGKEWKFNNVITDRDNGRVYYISDDVVTEDLDLYAHWTGRVEPDTISLSYKNGLIEPGEDVSVKASYFPLSADAPELEWTVNGGSDMVASQEVSDDGFTITLSIDKDADVVQSNKYVTVTAKSKTNQALSAQVSITVGHSWKLVSYQDSTCDKSGVKHYQCTKHENAQKNVALDPDGHRFVQSSRITKEPTCVAEGSYTDTYTCYVCNATEQVVTKIPPTGIHTWNTGDITIVPTCADTGIMTYTCKDCSATEEKIIPATGQHKYEKTSTVVDKEANCVNSGLHTDTYECTVCGAKRTEQVTDPATGNHDFYEFVNLNLGKRNHYQACKVCGKTEFLYTEEAELGDCIIVPDDTDNTDDGEAKEPDDTVTDDSTELVTDQDDTIRKENNSITASNVSKTYSTKIQSFSIEAKRLGNAKLTYSSNNKSVAVNSSGKVTIRAKFIGKAIITIKSAATAGYNSTSKKIAVTVNPSKPTLSSVKNTKGNKMLVKWKKDTAVTKYQIQYSTDRKFKSGLKTATVSKNGTVSKTIKSLKKGKTYNVRIRAYKTVSGAKYYSGWSNIKKVTISK